MNLRSGLALLGAALALSVVTTAQEPLAVVEHEGPLDRSLVIYDVRGVVPLAQEPGPVLTLSTEEDIEHQSADGDLDSLCRLARAFVEPRLLRGESIRAIANSYLVVFGRPAQQRWIQKFLQAQANEPKPQIDIQITVGFLHSGVDLSETFADAPDGASTELLAAQLVPGSEACVYSKPLAEYVRAALMESERFDMLNAPRLLTYTASDVSLSTISQTSIVRDYTELQIGSGADQVVIADPQVEVIQDGVTLRGRVCVLPDEAGFGVDFLLDFSELERPIPVVTTTLSNGSEVKIQIPELRRFELEARARLKNGEVLQIVGPLTDGKLPVLWLSAQKVEIPRESR